jgi:cardiolipin synthase
MPRWVVEALFAAYLIGGISFVVLERRHPRTTLSWVLALILLPVLGLIAYVVVGRRPYRRHVKRCRRRRESANLAMQQVARLDRLPDELSGPERGLVQLALRSAAAPLRRATAVEILQAGSEAFDAICGAIASAREHVHLEFYIWKDDASGRSLTELLTRKAAEGVSVRVLCDHLGSFSLPSAHFAPLIAAGGEVAFFAPLFTARIRRPRANFRNHRKLISVDSRVGFVGGLNVADEYLSEGREGVIWRDLFVRLEGDAVIGIETVFDGDWLDAHGSSPDADPVVGDPALGLDANRGPLVQIIPSGPDVQAGAAIAAQFSSAISTALERCWIATPYLVPDEPLKLTLQTAAMRGVDVRLLVPGRSDVRIVGLASRSYYDGLLEAGCAIYEYPEMLHSKYLIADRSVAAIGSANMDIRSFYLNYEVTAMFYDEGVTAVLAANFEADLAHSVRVGASDRAKLPGSRRMAEAFARVLSPLL